MIGRLRSAYGEGPLHLVGHLVVLAATGYAVVQLVHARAPVNIFAWLIGAALVHDFVFLPVYAAADRALTRALPRPRVPIVNHIRFVAIVAGALLLVWFPLILRRAPGNYVHLTGREPADYLGRWLALTAGLIAVSALVYVVRVVRARRVEELHETVRPAADEHPPRA